MYWDRQARNGVLLEAQRRNKKTMSDVLGAQNHFDRPVHGNGHTIHTDDVILRGNIFGVKTDRVFLIVDELWIRPAELAVCPGIADIPSELLGGYLDLNRVRGRFLQVQLRPDPLSHRRQTHKNHGHNEHHPDFELRVAMCVHDLALPPVTIAPNKPAQRYLRGYECKGNHNQSPHELCVDGWSVFGNSFRKPAVLARKQHDSEQRNQPQQHRESSTHALASFGMKIL